MDMERHWFPCVDRDIKRQSFASCICKIYEKLVDNKSREIYEKRLLYSLTNNYRCIYDIIKNEQAGIAFIDLLQKRGKFQNIYIYGAGIVGTRLPKLYPKINWAGYFDKKAAEYSVCNGMPVQNADDVCGGGVFGWLDCNFEYSWF